MAPPPAERPPSESGPEYQALDAIAELSRKIDELAQRPAIGRSPHPNWWDVLPQIERLDGRSDSLAEVVQGSGATYWLHVPARIPAYHLQLRVATYTDRLELSLQLNGGLIVWQRALFYERPAVA